MLPSRRSLLMAIAMQVALLLVWGSEGIHAQASSATAAPPGAAAGALDSAVARLLLDALATDGLLTKVSSAQGSPALAGVVGSFQSELAKAGQGSGTLRLDELHVTIEGEKTQPCVHLVCRATVLDAAGNVAEARSYDRRITIKPSQQKAFEREQRSGEAPYARSEAESVLSQAKTGSSLWSDTIVPTLVLLGTAALVALFFLIRS